MPFDFAANFPKMKRAASRYLKEAGTKHGINYIISLPPRSETDEDNKEPNSEAVGSYPTDYLTGVDAEYWIRSVVDFFRLGLEKQKAGMNPKVEVT